MIATVTNEHDTITIGALTAKDSGDNLGPARVYAVGGQRDYQLPHPFTHLEIAPGETGIVAVRPHDLHEREAGGHGTFKSVERLNQLIASDIISIAWADQPAQKYKDTEELMEIEM